MSLSQLYQPPRIAFPQNTYQLPLSSCEYCKVFKNGLFHRTPPKVVFCSSSPRILKSSFPHVFLKVSQTSQESTCLESLFKKLAGLQLHKKDSNTGVFTSLQNF